MDFNFLPTDNLYKFSAIVGLFLIIFSANYNSNKIDELEDERLKVIGNYNKIIDSQNRSLKELKENSSIFRTIDSNQRSSKKNMDEIQEQKYDSYNTQDLKIKNLLDKLREVRASMKGQIRNIDSFDIEYKESQSKLLEMNSQLLESKYILSIKERRVNYYRKLLIIFLGIGVIASIWGFLNWYHFQKKLDSLMKN